MKILILTNDHVGLYKFRKELVKELLRQHHKIYICLPYGEFVDELCRMGCRFIDCRLLDRHGTNPVEELRLIRFYRAVLKDIKPDIVFTYTIKPNVYGGMVCSHLGIPYVANITGLGIAVENGGWMQKLTLMLYKKGLKGAQKVFFQNRDNLRFFLKNKIVKNRYELLPGSGVNLEEYSYIEYPDTDNQVVFLTVGRLMRDKGTDEILEAARSIKKKHTQVVFRLIGDYDEKEYRKKVHRAVKDGIVEYAGFQSDIKPFMKDSHATIHASYHEGMSNVLLETAAVGRPIIATDVPGCIDVFTPEKSGIVFQPKDAVSLIAAIESFLQLSLEEKKAMGLMGRKKAEIKFDRNIIVNAYLDEVRIISQKNGLR